MDQTNWIGAFIVVGFVCYVIANNQLPGYLDVLGIDSQQSIGTQASALANGVTNGLGALRGLQGLP